MEIKQDKLKQERAMLQEEVEMLGVRRNRMFNLFQGTIEETGSACSPLIMTLLDEAMIRHRENDSRILQSLEELKLEERRLDREQDAAHHAHQAELHKLKRSAGNNADAYAE
ncbi:MAG: hypothetical protein LBH87_03600 [Coriobacteriales bacterium]|nr:hypothetical protein [Coriobacteriales bacterium]